jgi:type II protein arginine methyltransferase
MSAPPDQAPAHPIEDPAQFLALGLQLAEGATGGLARALAERALARHGDDPRWQALAGTVLRHEVPDFHVRMLRDGLRNAAYRAAIERFARGRVVLDIGTGSGLLAMMAARAGAAHVYACEASPLLAASARAVIAANGLADRITLFDRHSTGLDRVRDLGGGADLVVSEVFCHTLIGEGVLGSLAHARAELAAPEALFLPERASIEVALAEFPPFDAEIGAVEGFDLGAFGGHLHTARHCPADSPTLHLRSAPASLFAFDFTAGALPASGAAETTLTSDGGSITGLAQWLRLTFADDIVYENRPGSAPGLHWVIGLAPCTPGETAPGTRLRAGGAYAADTLSLWCAPESSIGA